MKKNTDYIIGIHPVIEAINSGKQIEKLLFKKGLIGGTFQELLRLAKEHKLPFQFVPPERLSKVTQANHQGVIALISPITYNDIEQVLPMIYEEGRDPFLLVLDQITDVRNFGAIVRTAECAGVDAVIIPSKGAASINSDAMKTSAGALNRMTICRTDNLLTSIQFLKNSGLKIVGASEKASSCYHEISMVEPLVVVMGAEDKGIAPAILRAVDELVKIPLKGNLDSLNVGVACGIILFEAVKQRH